MAMVKERQALGATFLMMRAPLVCSTALARVMTASARLKESGEAARYKRPPSPSRTIKTPSRRTHVVCTPKCRSAILRGGCDHKGSQPLAMLPRL
jgi:hypothetical protein